MSNSEKFKAGWVRDAHGLKGELYIQLFAKKADWLKSFEHFWLEPKAGGNSQNYIVERAKPHRDGLIVKPKAVLDRTQAEGLKGMTFLIPAEYLQAQQGEGLFLKQIEGFKVVDGQRELGIIAGFATNGAQDLLTVKTARQEILIPFVEAFIRKIDFDNRVVIMELPVGLDDDAGEEE